MRVNVLKDQLLWVGMWKDPFKSFSIIILGRYLQTWVRRAIRLSFKMTNGIKCRHPLNQSNLAWPLYSQCLKLIAYSHNWQKSSIYFPNRKAHQKSEIFITILVGGVEKICIKFNWWRCNCNRFFLQWAHSYRMHECFCIHHIR